MREIYLFENTGETRITRASENGRADPLLMQAAETDNFEWMEPLFAGGDTDLVFITVFRQPQNPGGIVLVSSGDEPLFCVIANTNLDLVAAASHFSSQVANIRYGQDIFDNVDEEE